MRRPMGDSNALGERYIRIICDGSGLVYGKTKWIFVHGRATVTFITGHSAALGLELKLVDGVL